MDDDPLSDEPDGDDEAGESDLTPEDQESVRRMASTFEVAIRKAFEASKLTGPHFGIPPAFLKNVIGDTSLSAQIAKHFRPAVQTPAWLKQFQEVNSDLLKNAGPFQVQMQPIFRQLTQNVDLSGVTSQYAKLAEQIGNQQAAWFRDVLPDLKKLSEAFWPPNLRGIEGLDLNEVEAIVLLDGIALYNVPRRSIAEALIRAGSAADRRTILGRRWQAISHDCREAMEGCRSKTLALYVTVAIAAIDALEAGHTKAAQALVGSLVESILSAYLGNDRYLYTPNDRTKNTDAYKELAIRKFIALAPMWTAYQQFRTHKGDAVPKTFNRNATAHTVNDRQFNRRNAVQGLLFACGLITFLDELARRLENARGAEPSQ